MRLSFGEFSRTDDRSHCIDGSMVRHSFLEAVPGAFCISAEYPYLKLGDCKQNLLFIVHFSGLYFIPAPVQKLGDRNQLVTFL